MTRRTAAWQLTTGDGTDPMTVTLAAPVDVADGDILCWVICGAGNSLIDFATGGTLEGGSITVPAAWTVGEYSYEAPGYFAGENFHVYLREWHTGDATSEDFTLAAGLGSTSGLPVYGIVLGWDAWVSEAASDHQLGWQDSSADPFTIGPGTWSHGKEHVLLVLAQSGLGDPGIVVGSTDFTNWDTETGLGSNVLLFAGDNHGAEADPSDYDLTVTGAGGGMNTRWAELLLDDPPPVRSTDPIPATADNELAVRARRVHVKELPFTISTAMVKELPK